MGAAVVREGRGKAVSDQDSRRFMEMLTAHQRDIYCYVNMLLAGNSSTADVVQDTNIDLWSNMDKFDFERPFLPWAMKFAYNRVRAHRKARGRSRLVFSDAFVQSLSEECSADTARADERLTALRSCLQRLPADHRQLVTDRYQGTLSVNSLAARAGLTPSSVSAQLYRIRRALARCIEARLPTPEGGPKA